MLFRRKTKKSKPLGAQGEDVAVQALRRAGYRILDRNVRLFRYEIDIIARDKDMLVFVEVKTRRSGDEVAPEANVSPVKQRHIAQAAAMYLDREGLTDSWSRFDVVSVVLPEDGPASIEIFRDAFRA